MRRSQSRRPKGTVSCSRARVCTVAYMHQHRTMRRLRTCKTAGARHLSDEASWLRERHASAVASGVLLVHRPARRHDSHCCDDRRAVVWIRGGACISARPLPHLQIRRPPLSRSAAANTRINSRRAQPHARPRSSSGPIKSRGKGKTIVDDRSFAMSASVCRYRSCIARGSAASVRAASTSMAAA